MLSQGITWRLRKVVAKQYLFPFGRQADDMGSFPHFPSQVVHCGHCPVTLPLTSGSLWTLSCDFAPHKWFIVDTVLWLFPSQVVRYGHCPVTFPLTSGSLWTLYCHFAPHKWFIVDTVLLCCPWQVVHCGHCPVTLPLTIKETSKRLSSLLIWMKDWFWWWQCSGG